MLVERANNLFNMFTGKPIFSSLGISYFSFCAYRLKVIAIKNLLNRANNMSSNYQFLHSEFQIHKYFFHSNGLPLNYKVRLPISSRSLVYKFSCARCASENMGSTSRIIPTRISEHAGRSHRINFLLSTPFASYVRVHTSH